MANNILLNLPRATTKVILNHVQRRNMPVNVPPTATGKRRFRLEVETDPHKLVNYCCGLNYHQNEPLIKLKPDNEYPDWLWTLRLQPEPPSWEMEPGTKEYYLKSKKEEIDKNYLIRMTKGGVKKVVGEQLKKNAEYLHRKRFAALAHMEEDAGLEQDSMETDWNRNVRLNVEKRRFYLPMMEDRVMYMDKIPGNTHTKNFYHNVENTFAKEIRMEKRPSNKLEAIQDSKMRHRYSVN